MPSTSPAPDLAELRRLLTDYNAECSRLIPAVTAGLLDWASWLIDRAEECKRLRDLLLPCVVEHLNEALEAMDGGTMDDVGEQVRNALNEIEVARKGMASLGVGGVPRITRLPEPSPLSLRIAALFYPVDRSTPPERVEATLDAARRIDAELRKEGPRA